MESAQKLVENSEYGAALATCLVYQPTGPIVEVYPDPIAQPPKKLGRPARVVTNTCPKILAAGINIGKPCGRAVSQKGDQTHCYNHQNPQSEPVMQQCVCIIPEYHATRYQTDEKEVLYRRVMVRCTRNTQSECGKCSIHKTYSQTV